MKAKLSAKACTGLLYELDDSPFVFETKKESYKDTDDPALQDMFNLLIREGRYSDQPSGTDEYNTLYMCEAASLAVDDGLLTHDCEKTITEAISNYLGGVGQLGLLLKDNGLPSEFEDCKAIYLDWLQKIQRIISQKQ